ncbi:hypothetical protein ONV78_17965 [Hahella sp. CR1]|uniref:hypothetical protein n=1 Tax=Hahella sp. CR1 TaxID=2992807 RepID=UPI0024414234|nr:hypothetical protein [Hahella sp. CR1]MDG9669628.1 hypothetical protein [Hahella sp. CR1]
MIQWEVWIVLTLGALVAALLWAMSREQSRYSMTKPSYILLDQSFSTTGRRQCEVRLLTTLSCKSKNGVTIRGQVVWLINDEQVIEFPHWFHLNSKSQRVSEKLVVPREGITVEQHFLSADSEDVNFKAGTYELVLFETVRGKLRGSAMGRVLFLINEYQAQELKAAPVGLCLRWDDKYHCYHSSMTPSQVAANYVESRWQKHPVH